LGTIEKPLDRAVCKPTQHAALARGRMGIDADAARALPASVREVRRALETPWPCWTAIGRVGCEWAESKSVTEQLDE